jgi:cytoskeletal protein RodZ
MSDKPATDSPSSDDTLKARRHELGARLKGLREAHGLTTRGVSQSTRITLAFIEALEEGAFERLPGQVFGRGFVRGLSKQLGADPDELLAAYEACWIASGPPKSVLKVEIKNKPMPESSAALELVRRGARAAVSRPEIVRGTLAVAGVGAVVAALVVTAGTWRPWLDGAVVRAREATASLGAIGGGATAANSVATTASPRAAVPPAPVVAAKAEAKDDDDDAIETASAPSANAAQDVETQETAAASAAATAASQPGHEHEQAPAGGHPAASVAAESASAKPVANTAPAAAAPAPALASATPAPQGDQTLEFVVSAPVKVRIGLDSGETVVKELTPETYRFAFKDRADLMIYDAAALKISYNGRPLGTLGAKGRVRRLSFETAGPTDKKL